MNINVPQRGRGFVLPFYKDHKVQHNTGSESTSRSNGLPFLNWISDDIRKLFVATSAEFAGTTLFLFFAFSGTQVALLAKPASSGNEVGTPSNPDQLLYIALSFGFSLAVNAWVFFRISGGLFNPAVTLGMCLIGALPYSRGLFLAISQILGGITAAATVSALFPGPLTVRTNLAGGTSISQGLFIEMFLTAELVFTIFMLAAEKHKGTFIAPVGIGLSLFIAELTGVYYTGGSVNPARSFGPSVVTHQFHHYHWIYWIGPILGALLATGFYKFIKMLEYETVNPGQDASKDAGEGSGPDQGDDDQDDGRDQNRDHDHDQRQRYGSSNPNENARLRRTASNRSSRSAGREKQNGGTNRLPKKYTTERRPPSRDRPAAPNPNGHYAQTTEDGTYWENTNRRERGRGPKETFDTNGAPLMVLRPAIKKKPVGSSPRGEERSVRSNSRYNRHINSGIPGDEEFFEKN